MGFAGAVIAVFVCLSGLVYLYLRRQQQQWKRLGIPAAAKPHLLFGNVAGIARIEHSSAIHQRMYWDFKQRGLSFGGFMNFFQPAILVVEPDLVKNVLVKDFNAFHDRGIFVDPVGDPLSGTLFSLEGVQWKLMRQKLTPTFTSGKMKQMYGLMQDVALEMKKFVASNCHREDFELKDMLQRFTMDVIGNVAFGIRCDTMNTPSSEFSTMGCKAFQLDTVRLFKFFVMGSYKKLARTMGMKTTFPDVEKFFLELTESTVELRESSGEKRNDFLNLLIDIKNKGKLSSEPNSGGQGITMEEMAAQCFVFFTAGFETSSMTINYCLYELAMNEDIQDRVRSEIQQAMASNGGQLTYESLMTMDLLDRVVSETLRKYPPVDNLFRMTTIDYKVPDTKYTIPAETLCQIPIYSIHHDPEYFPEPECFDPDRFLPEMVKARRPYTYLPFGEGPRNCIGMRFGLMQTKLGLATLLTNFHFSPNARTPRKLEINPTSFLVSMKGGMYLAIRPLEAY